jgi:small-conductance mechanosensitive channel
LDTPGILRDPEPEVLFRALAAAALNLQIVAWTDRIEQVAVVQQRLMSRVWETTTAEGIALA